MKILLIVLGAALLFILLSGKERIFKVLDWFSVFWFRLAMSFLGLFVLHIAAGFLGVFVPINIASGLVVALLGIPGLASILTIAVVL
ncbi:pro-sigmaK processing inhibitor BofA family protein [Chungangia koreensis]|uniref:Pro-sigmaK processing inhibitor BofA family protein n=1 Tax=Chungangia koreensis TaxID=752657 RepID=A0ABV8X4J3_9LACT